MSACFDTAQNKALGHVNPCSLGVLAGVKPNQGYGQMSLHLGFLLVSKGVVTPPRPRWSRALTFTVDWLAKYHRTTGFPICQTDTPLTFLPRWRRVYLL